ncbi:hypothetical protein V8G57_24945 [Collimonas sp. H4R21]|uniref:Ribbon-helix-helix CopG family protein n=1 Tax=Collimonas rhizosphaerae TaxID=3126357 RepID=A0ABU9Q382_9BURK
MKKPGVIRRAPKYLLAEAIAVRLTTEEQTTVEQYAYEGAESRAAFLRRMIMLGVKQHKRNLSKTKS